MGRPRGAAAPPARAGALNRLRTVGWRRGTTWRSPRAPAPAPHARSTGDRRRSSRTLHPPRSTPAPPAPRTEATMGLEWRRPRPEGGRSTQVSERALAGTTPRRPPEEEAIQTTARSRQVVGRSGTPRSPLHSIDDCEVPHDALRDPIPLHPPMRPTMPNPGHLDRSIPEGPVARQPPPTSRSRAGGAAAQERGGSVAQA